MKFFSRKDKSKTGGSRQEDNEYKQQQHYAALDSPSGPEFVVSPPSVDANSAASGSGGGGRSGGLRGFRNARHGGRRSASESGSASATALSSGSGSALAQLSFSATGASARVLARFPDAVLARIFALVCPHSQDDAYETCEESSRGNTCMLCDMRDLAHCTRVCRRWRVLAEQVLYTSIRIDSVHYCEREAYLADKRKRRSFFDRNAEPENTPASRLQLLCRTLRDSPTHHLARWVQFLKLPYMLRESNYADIARTVSVLPNLRYVDLPEGLFMDEPVYATLRREIQAKCPDLRKMTYVGGAERQLEALASGTLWRNLEVLELVRIGADPALLRQVIGSLPNLRALKVTEAATGPHAFSDDVLLTSPGPSAHDRFSSFPGYSFESPNVPPLEELILTDTRSVTADGLLDYLGRPETQRALQVLTVSGTGVKPWALQAILAQAPCLRHLTIVDEVSATLPVAAGTHEIQPLHSESLRTLNYEIRVASGVSVYAGVTRSYYNYLSGSILSGGLPNLRAVYVRDAQFPESLLASTLAPPRPVLGGDFGRPSSSGSASSTTSAFRSPRSTGSQAPLFSPSAYPSGAPRSPGLAPFAPSAGANPFLDRQPEVSSPASSSSMAAAASGMSLAPPSTPWAAGHNPRFSSNNPFAGMISPQKMQMLEVFTKGDDDLDWSSIVVNGGDGDFGGPGMDFGGGGGSSSRPVSSYGLGADLGAVGARKSVLVNVGPGNYLAVPDDGGGSGGGSGGSGGGSGSSGHGQDLWPRPKSSSGVKKSEKMDLWR